MTQSAKDAAHNEEIKQREADGAARDRKERQKFEDDMRGASQSGGGGGGGGGGAGGGGGSCWIATAYFRDPNHAEVVRLREWRTQLFNTPFIGGTVRSLNEAYHWFGRRWLGAWWRDSVAYSTILGLPRFGSAVVVHSGLLIGKAIELLNRQRR